MTKSLVDDLTDRQRTVFDVAYHSGFFEWPRDATAEEIAASLDVSAPTFHQHLRLAQKLLLDALYASDSLTPRNDPCTPRWRRHK